MSLKKFAVLLLLSTLHPTSSNGQPAIQQPLTNSLFPPGTYQLPENICTPSSTRNSSNVRNGRSFSFSQRNWEGESDSASNQWPNKETPWNLGFLFVPQGQVWVVERMGKFDRILEPGVNFAWPVIDSVAYIITLKEFAIDIPVQHAVTKDNVALVIDGILYLKIIHPLRASYGVHNPGFAVTQLAQATMRSELGKMSLDSIFHEREELNKKIVDDLNKATAAWGICCLRYEIRDIQIPPKIKAAMELEVEAERNKRAKILQSEGNREAEINISEGRKIARILASEAEKQEQINAAEGAAAAIVAAAKAKALASEAEKQGKIVKAEADAIALLKAAQAKAEAAEAEKQGTITAAEANAVAILSAARAKAQALEEVGKALQSDIGNNAASLLVAQEYVEAFKGMAKQSTTMLLQKDTSDIAGTVAQALSVYHGVKGGFERERSGPNPKITSN